MPRDDHEHAAEILDALCADAAGMPDLVVDDIDLLADGPFALRLEELLRSRPDGDQVIAMSAASDFAAAAFRGPLAQARRAKAGLLLCPTGPHDGELFGVRLPRRSSGDEPPGRGWVADAGRATRMQVALPVPLGVPIPT